jgi:thiol-disulfide isomerase/thioredoxin
MSRAAVLLACSLLPVLVGGLALKSAGRGLAQPPRPQASALDPHPAPPWANGSWLNSSHPLKLDELRGRVILLNFWVFTCGNCTRTVPSLVDFDRRYRESGLTLIGVHTPEFPPYAGEHDRDNVARALQEYGIKYPVAQDNDSRTWNLYGIRYWPSFVLVDKRGMVRYEGFGEFHLRDGSYELWDRRIRELLAE